MPYKNPEDKKANSRAYYLKNKEEINKKNKDYYESHKEQCYKVSKTYAENHKAEIKDYQRGYRKDHKVDRNEYFKEYYSNEFNHERRRIEARDRDRLKKLGLILEGQQVHHHVYHADNNDESWMEDIEIMDKRQHKAWHEFHKEWKPIIV